VRPVASPPDAAGFWPATALADPLRITLSPAAVERPGWKHYVPTHGRAIADVVCLLIYRKLPGFEPDGSTGPGRIVDSGVPTS
jgi:hypothetical protein